MSSLDANLVEDINVHLGYTLLSCLAVPRQVMKGGILIEKINIILQLGAHMFEFFSVHPPPQSLLIEKYMSERKKHFRLAFSPTC